jgi:hypothetical protein
MAATPKNPTPSKNGDAEDVVLFQKYFKSLGPRAYAAQIKRASNGNHCLVIIESKRDPETHEVKKSKVLIWSEDLASFFKMMQETLHFHKANPVPEEIRKRRERYWQKRAEESAGGDDADLAEFSAVVVTPVKRAAPKQNLTKQPAGPSRPPEPQHNKNPDGIPAEPPRPPRPIVTHAVKPPSKPRPNGITIKPSGKNPPRPMERTALVKGPPGRTTVNRITMPTNLKKSKSVKK